jgi:hypothetical protein
MADMSLVLCAQRSDIAHIIFCLRVLISAMDHLEAYKHGALNKAWYGLKSIRPF